MSRNKLTLVIGILLVLMPFLGFPSSWKTFFYCFSGGVFIILAVYTHAKKRAGSNHGENVATDVYIQKNIPKIENDML